MSLNKKEDLPDVHSRINADSMDDYNYKIEILKKIIKNNKSDFSYMEFKDSEYIKDDDDKVFLSHANYNITNDEKFLNLKNKMSMWSLIVNFVKKEPTLNIEYQNNMKWYLLSFFNIFYDKLILKLINNDEITINKILLMLVSFESEIEKCSAYVGKELVSKDEICFYKKYFYFYKLDEVLYKMMDVDFGIKHQDINYSHLFFSHSPITFFGVDEFYEKVIFDSITQSGIQEVLSGKLDEKNQFSKKPLYAGMNERKKMFVFFNKTKNSSFVSPVLYSQLRGLGVRLVIPNKIDELDKFVKANFIEFD